MPMMNNPYSAPETTGELLETKVALESPSSQQNSWKQIAYRWECLRIPFNIVVGSIGVLCTLGMAPMPNSELLAGILIFGIGANICYFFGPISEMYLNWFVDLYEARHPTNAITRWLRSSAYTYVVFTAGLIFSMLLTFIVAILAQMKV